MILFYLGAAVVTIIVGVLVFNRMNGPQSQRGGRCPHRSYFFFFSLLR